jgi:hypothetical protein
VMRFSLLAGSEMERYSRIYHDKDLCQLLVDTLTPQLWDFASDASNQVLMNNSLKDE